MNGTISMSVEPVTVENATTSNNVVGSFAANEVIPDSSPSRREQQTSLETLDNTQVMDTIPAAIDSQLPPSVVPSTMHLSATLNVLEVPELGALNLESCEGCSLQHGVHESVSTEHTMNESLEDTSIDANCPVVESTASTSKNVHTMILNGSKQFKLS
ncbi:hypothetical protein V6N12_038173 [Hibiscus sabdariffa]|uniref:Uncharacterized protein n=1 Tax=Hibiscus sabdariffa TaxID=183260 RepID=A0ABR2BWY3_9ROSI